jgi:hypothetical protein
MSKSLYTEKQAILMEYGLSENQAAKLVAGSAYFCKNGGIDSATYWHDAKAFDIRDEFFLIANSHLIFIRLINDIDVDDLADWLGELQVAYLYQLKLNAQSTKSIDVLLSHNCYADAFAVCRTIQSRVNLLLLCSFAPHLFDQWLKNPNESRFREGQVRKELASLGINTMDHVYKLASEVIHGHSLGHGNIGYFEKGLFKDIPQVRHQIYVISKFLLAASTYAIIQTTLIGSKSGANLTDTHDMDQLYEHFFNTILAPARLDHLLTIIAENRHWKQIGADRYNWGGTYSYAQLKKQIQEFHRSDGVQKKLSKRYQLDTRDG